MNPVPFSWMVIGLIVAAAVGASGSWHVAAWKYDVEKERSIVAAQEAQVRAEKRADEISSVFIAKLDNIKVVNTTINAKVKHELETRVYSDCKLPESGRVLLNSGIDSANDALGFVRTMPADPPAGATAGPVGSDDGRSVSARSRFDAALHDLRAQAAGGSAKHDSAKEGKRKPAGAVTAPLRE